MSCGLKFSFLVYESIKCITRGLSWGVYSFHSLSGSGASGQTPSVPVAFFQTGGVMPSFWAFSAGKKKACCAVFIIRVTDWKCVQFLKKFSLCFPWKAKAAYGPIFFKLFDHFNSNSYFWYAACQKYLPNTRVQKSFHWERHFGLVWKVNELFYFWAFVSCSSSEQSHVSKHTALGGFVS